MNSAAEVEQARFWKPADNNFADCFLCAHRCHVAPGKRGFCRVRENRDGTLFTLVYHRIIAANADPIEKKPLFHVLPGTQSFSIATVGCNFHCGFCQNWQISQGQDTASFGRRMSPAAIVNAATTYECASIAYTYTEPTIFFELAADTADLARERGIKNVFVTNGYQSPETVDAMLGRIDAANVDLKSFSRDFYRKACRGDLDPVLANIRRMHEGGMMVEVTTLVIPGENDSPDELRAITDFLADVSPDIPWHVSRFHPDYEFDDHVATPPETVYRALEIAADAGLRYCYAGNLPGGGHEDTDCPACGRTVIRRSGYRVDTSGLNDGACASCGESVHVLA